ncbi:MAG: PEGA domain-containing protein [Deltaproteobacteria bacterium]|nr:PEGA domain-containing protein [Deltaproteobacteria bacterium]
MARPIIVIATILYAGTILPSARLEAQPPAPLLVVSTDEAAPRPPQALLRELAAATVNGQQLATGRAGSELVRAHASYEKSEQAGNPFDRLREHVNEALTALAHGEAETARQGLGEVIQNAEEALDLLGRREEAARELLDACLFSARTFLDRGLRADARREVFRCRRLVPDLNPTMVRHPPEVRELLSEVDRELPTLQRALRVESSPSGCAVRVNGRELGTTPYEARTPPGFYTLAVECPARGDSPMLSSRVHPLILGSEPITVSIDTRLDAALITDDDRGVSLRYPADMVPAATRWADLLALGRSSHVSTLVGLTFDGGRWRLDRIDVDGQRVTATAWLSATPELAAIRAAVDAIEERRSVDFSGAEERPASPWEPPAPLATVESEEGASPAAVPSAAGPATAIPPTQRSSRGRRAAGWSLAALGAVSLGTAWALHFSLDAKRRTLRMADPMLATFSQAQSDLDTRRGLSTGLTLGATALLVTAAPLLVPDQDESVSALAWALGAAGVVLTGVAAGFMIAGSSACIDTGCTRSRQSWRAGLLILAHATPLLTVPITALARRSGGEDQLSASATRRGGMVSWRRNF